MKIARRVTFSTMLMAALSSTVWASSEADFLQRSAVWVTGTYTESSNNGMSYGALVQQAGIVANGTNGEKRHVFVDPDLEFDYALGYSYHFPDSQTRFFFTYDHFTDENTSTNQTIENLHRVPTIANPTVGWGQARNHADELRFGLAHALHFSPLFHLDLSGFFEWDEVKRDLNEWIVGGGSPGVAYRNTYNRVQGWGPGVGARARTAPFLCYPDVGFFVGANTTLLWADNVYETDFWDQTTLMYHYDPEHTESVVGKIDISFGLDYARRLSNMVVDVALGVRYMNMFNVFKNGNAYENPVYPGSGAINYAANLGYPNDWGRVGPFLTFAIGGTQA